MISGTPHTQKAALITPNQAKFFSIGLCAKYKGNQLCAQLAIISSQENESKKELSITFADRFQSFIEQFHE